MSIFPKARLPHRNDIDWNLGQGTTRHPAVLVSPTRVVDNRNCVPATGGALTNSTKGIQPLRPSRPITISKRKTRQSGVIINSLQGTRTISKLSIPLRRSPVIFDLAGNATTVRTVTRTPNIWREKQYDTETLTTVTLGQTQGPHTCQVIATSVAKEIYDLLGPSTCNDKRISIRIDYSEIPAERFAYYLTIPKP